MQPGGPTDSHDAPGITARPHWVRTRGLKTHGGIALRRAANPGRFWPPSVCNIPVHQRSVFASWQPAANETNSKKAYNLLPMRQKAYNKYEREKQNMDDSCENSHF